MRPTFIRVNASDNTNRLASAIHLNPCSLRHSLRIVQLGHSLEAFCAGWPGSMNRCSEHLTPTPNQNTCLPILPFCHFTLKASKTALRLRKLVQMGFTMKPETLGQHLLSRRLALNLTQAQAAERLNTLREQYDRWERDEVAPEISMWPRLIHFLGDYPANCQSPADWVLRARRTLGLSQFAIGRKVGIIAETIRKWEHGKAEPPQDLLSRFQEMGRVA